ncbi:hypothetical protein VUR80DRAFT_4283 [Thermomyces stellatus]
MPADYSSTARALSLSPTPASPALGHPFTRPRTAARLSAGPRRGDPKSVSARLYDALVTTGQTLVRGYLVLSPRQRVLFIIATIISAIISVLFLIYSPRLFTALGPVAQSWRETPGGWLLIWLAVFGSAFPPLIGYSTVNTVAGFIYGFPNAWPLVATASTLGSLASFVASRTVLSGYVDRLVGKDPRFVALGQVLRKEGLGMLTMIRFCPLPYSLSNGFLATIPSIGPLAFAVSTAFASPKLLVHVFIGSRIALLAEGDDSMSASTKALNYISMIVSGAVGTAVGWLIYRRTMARAAEIALENAAEEGLVSPRAAEAWMEGYADERDPGDVLAGADDISLWDGYGSGYTDGGEEGSRRISPATSPLGFAKGNGKGAD